MAEIIKHIFSMSSATAAVWLTNDPIIPLGTHGFETDTGRLKIGNGTDTWSDLPYSDVHTVLFPLTNVSYSGNIGIFTAGSSLSAYDLCYLGTDGKYYKADADTATTMPAIALALEAMSANGTGKFLLQGIVSNSSWSFTNSTILYVHNNPGEIMTVSPNGTGDQVQRIGIAINSNTILFSPSLDVIEIS
jgi:hypothetical protein